MTDVFVYCCVFLRLWGLLTEHFNAAKYANYATWMGFQWQLTRKSVTDRSEKKLGLCPQAPGNNVEGQNKKLLWLSITWFSATRKAVQRETSKLRPICTILMWLKLVKFIPACEKLQGWAFGDCRRYRSCLRKQDNEIALTSNSLFTGETASGISIVSRERGFSFSARQPM